MSPVRPRLTARRVIVAVGLAALVLAAAAAVVVLRQPGDVNNADVPFEPDTAAPPAPPPAPAPRATEDPVDRFTWPVYGYTKDRRRHLPAGAALRPPYRTTWAVNVGVLIEFSPVIGGRWLYLLDDDGFLWSIAKDTGRVRWKRRMGVLAAAAPAYGGGRVYVTLLARSPGQAGRVAALRARDGRVLWSRPLPSRSESSPLLDSGRLYFGTEDGTVYALRASDGATRWRFRAQGAVKGGLALTDRRLYFGDYAGRVYAVRQADGRPVWQVGTNGARLGLTSGRFYATAAVAYGRVYLGNTDGFVYSFAARDGRLAWRHQTGGYVYASPAVAQVRGGRPTVYIGSYDGTFYALDARSGSVRWRHREGGSISGAATVVGDVVYFSNTRLRTTTGLGARTGKMLMRRRDGAYNPVVSDTRMIFFTGKKKLYGLRPRSAPGRSTSR
jgi:outer membrane protein assembly factor BamB